MQQLQGQEYQSFNDLPEHQAYPGSQGYQEDNQYPPYAEDEVHSLHVYVYEDDPSHKSYWNKDHLVALAMGILALTLIVGLCFIPSEPSYSIQTITVPAHFIPQERKASEPIHMTGTKTYPAIKASGTLTIYNGSFLAQQLPDHFILTTPNGVEVATDQTVIIPSGSPPSYGTVTVSAHAVIPGSQGNIQPYAINQTYGSAIYIKNLVPFANGQDAYTKTYATEQDRAKALNAARAQVTAEKPMGLLARPCIETVTSHESTLAVSWFCQFVTYKIPKNMQVISVQVSGNVVFVRVKVAVPAVMRIEK